MKKALTLTAVICGLLTINYGLATAQNVGVDVASPVEKLDVLGAIRIGTTSNTNAGTIRWNSPNFQGYDGTQWINFGGGTLTGSGTATRVAFWSGTSALSSSANLYWDNTNSRLGVGITTPLGVLSAGSTMGNKVLAYDDGTSAAGLGIQSGVLQMFTSNNTSNIVFGYGSSGSFTENVRFMGTGNVGIGTTAPSEKLDVWGNLDLSAVQPFLKFSATGTPRTSNITTTFSPINTVGQTMRFNVSDNTNTGTTEIMRLQGDGTVGIGTTSPVNKLDIEGGMAVGASYSGTSVAPTNGAIIQGNVGIGTTAPGNKLFIKNDEFNAGVLGLDNANGGGFTGMYLWQGTTLNGYIGHVHSSSGFAGPGLMHFASTGSDLVFSVDAGTAFNERMRITTAGNAGIGTSAPTQKLDVNGQIRMRSGATTGYVPVSDANGTMTWTDPSTIVGNEAWKLTGNSGTNPTNNFLGTTDNVDLRFRTNNAVRLTVTAAGNVGIGSTSPSQVLDVYGRMALSHGFNNTNVYVGRGSGVVSTSAYLNTAVGVEALAAITTSGDNTALGYRNMTALSTGGANSSIGSYALSSATTAGSNVALGYGALNSLVDGSNNVAVGRAAGSGNTNGSGNVFIGFRAGDGSTGSNELYIDNSNTASPLIYGNFSTNLLRINGTLNVNNAYSFPTADGTANYVLQTNGSGTVSWVNPTSLTITETDPQVSSTTTNYIPKWNGTALVDGVGYDNGTNVGIGTTAPDYKLHVSGSDFLTLKLVAPNSPLLKLSSPNYNGGNGAEFWQDNTGDARLNINGTINAIYMKATGDVGIGITFPSVPTARLDVNNGTSTVPIFLARDNGTEVMRIADGGNVGIGTTGPAEKLEVAGTIKATNPGTSPSGSSIKLSSPANDIGVTMDRGNGSGGSQQRWDMKITSDNALRFRSQNTTDYFAFTNAGNFGIGTTAPVNKLDIEGGLAVGATYSGTNTATANGAIIEGNVGIGTSAPTEKLDVLNGNLTVRTNANGTTAKIIISGARNGGNIGWNNTAGTGHSILEFVNYDGGNSSTFYTSGRIESANQPGSDDGDLRFYTSSDMVLQEVMRMDNTGNVGIGQEPTQKLDVNGKIRMRTGASTGYVPVSDANGTMTWTDPATLTISVDEIRDADNDTKIQVEESADEDIIRFDAAGTQLYTMRKMAGGSPWLEVNSTNTLIGSTISTAINGAGVYNTAVGYQAAQSLSTGQKNTYYGDNAGGLNTTGNNNTMIGTVAGQFNDGGSANTIIGGYAGRNNLTGSGNVFLGFGTGENETGSNKLYIDNSNTTNPLIYGDFGTNVLGFNGNVGIGINAPVNKLDVEGGMAVGATYSGTNTAPTNGAIIEGNVGIGTTSPSGPIHVNTSTAGRYMRYHDFGNLSLYNPNGSPAVELRLGEAWGRPGLYSSGRLELQSGTTGILFGNNDVEYMRMTSAGNLGIGTTAPGAYLDITGTNGGSTSLQLRSGNTGVGTTSNQLTFGYSGTETYRHAIKTRHSSSGNASNAIDFYLWSFDNDAAGTVGTQQVMTIDGGNGGSVGIGTTTPTTKLEVNGTVKATALAGAFDQSASGYSRIGNMQIAWGTITLASGDAWTDAGDLSYVLASQSISFPANFNAIPSVTFSQIDGQIAARSAYITYHNPSTTGVSNIYLASPDPNHGNTTGVVVHWMAIGTWQ
ncbi:MAG: beta strand repeat-containing protein [Bacteroidia bacterium]